ncbi:MAG: HAD family phosphatase [Spirochaetales bacterium]
MKPITTIYFDFGNVLTHPSHDLLNSFLKNLANKKNLSYSLLHKAYVTHRPEYDRDTLSPAEYWSTLLTEAGGSLKPEELSWLIEQDDHCWSQINEEVIEWIKVLKQEGFALGLLTNMPYRFFQVVVASSQWKGLFQYLVVSGQLGYIKPQEEIFHYAVKICGASPEQILYLDDIEEHIKTASRLGIQAYQFTHLSEIANTLCPLYHLPFPPSLLAKVVR